MLTHRPVIHKPIKPDKNKDSLHKLWLSFPDSKVVGRLTDIPNIDAILTDDNTAARGPIKQDNNDVKIRYDLPGIRFRTYPKMDKLVCITPPTVGDYINIIIHKQTEYILTEHGIWMIQPLRTTTFITECALSYYVIILNTIIFDLHGNNIQSVSHPRSAVLYKSRHDTNYIAKTYSKLISSPDGRLLNIPKELQKIAINNTIDIISDIYPTNPSNKQKPISPDVIKSSIFAGIQQFIGDPPVKVTWHPY